MDEISYMSAIELKKLIFKKEISSEEVMKQTLYRLDKLEKELNAFSYVDYENALLQAKDADKKLNNGESKGLLHGLPISIKDLIDVKGMNTTFGSKVMKDNYRDKDAPAVERVRSAGACIIGKTTTTEFGCKAGGGDSPLTGITRNAWDTNLTPGGSSSGSATSVAAGITPFSLGTDGGGSIRIPSSFCGLFGIKAQFGRVPIFPASATPTLAHVGPLARNVGDAALLLQVISGFDDRDPTTISESVPQYLDYDKGEYKKLRIAWSPTMGYAKPTKEVLNTVEKAIKLLDAQGYNIELIENPFESEDPIELWTAEFYAGAGTKLKEPLDNRRDQLDPAVADILEGALNQDMYEYYTKVFKRYDYHNKVQRFFDKYDLLLTPTLPVTPFAAGKNVPDELDERNIVSWVYYTYPFNLSGNPAASINCGFTQDGLPVGLQIVSGKNKEVDIFKLAFAYEKLSGLNGIHPELTC